MKLKAPKGCGAVSWGGENYPVVEGVVDVPAEAAATLLEPGWGFDVAGEMPALPPKTENRKPKTGI